jgi:hypothetical protein
MGGAARLEAARPRERRAEKMAPWLACKWEGLLDLEGNALNIE